MKKNYFGIMAVAALLAAEQASPITPRLSQPYKPPRPQPRMVTAPRSEIEEWNAAVDRRKAEKRNRGTAND